MILESELQKTLANLPLEPGCYLYRDDSGNVIYVGKAKNLKKRISSYFHKDLLDPHIVNLVRSIMNIEYIVTDSELEAFILETNLIKKYMPYFNRDLKDDKNYIWIMIDRKEDFPRLQVVRTKRSKSAIYLGPYHYTMPVRRILKRLRKIYPYRTCNRIIIETHNKETNKIEIKSSDSNPCLYYHLGLCQAPCAGLVNSNTYRKNINGINTFFTKGHNSLVKELVESMKKYSVNLEFEKAAELRNKIQDLEYIKQRVSVETELTDEFELNSKKNKKSINAVEEIIRKISTNDISYKEGFKIECFDISNIQGTNAVGSMVVFIDGKPAKNLYRKFKIKTKTTPDDFAMMTEVLKRRFKHTEINSDDSFSILPDLLIVDGGKGQLSSAHKVLTDLRIAIPLIGLAKKNEDIFMLKDNNGELEFRQRRLRYASDGYFLLQRIRDESHRFAINYHRKLRSIGQTASVLDDIPGIGKLTKKRLIQAFGTVDGIKKAKRKDLEVIIKNNTSLNNLLKVIESIG